MNSAKWLATWTAMLLTLFVDTNAQQGDSDVACCPLGSLVSVEEELLSVLSVLSWLSWLSVLLLATISLSSPPPPLGFKHMDCHITVSKSSCNRGMPSLFLSMHVNMGAAMASVFNTSNQWCAAHSVFVLSLMPPRVAMSATTSGLNVSFIVPSCCTRSLVSVLDEGVPSKTPTTA